MKYLYLLFCLLLGVSLQAQIKIGDNPQTIDPSSVLELESSSRVLVITRVNTTEMNAITPSAGAMVYNTDIQCIHYYTGTEWKDICDAVAGSITFTSDDGTVVITPNGGNNYDIKVGQITGMNIVNETVFGADIATATIGERQLAPNSVGSSELQDNTVGKDEIQEAAVGTLEIIDGTIQPSDMQPGAFDQLLTTDAAGNVVWLNKSDLGATQADQTTITGAGTTTDPIKVADTVIGEILANTNSITVNTNNIAQNSNDIADINTALGTKEDLINKSDNIALGNSTTLYPTQNAVKTYVDQLAGAASTLADGNIFVGNPSNVATGVTMGGDATIISSGVLTIADGAITSPKIALNAVGQPHLADNAVISSKILNGNVTPIKIQPGANNEIMTTNTLGVVTWQPIAAVGGNQDLASVLGFGTSAGNNQINDLVDPTLPQDAATRAYVDAQVGGSAQTIVSADTPANSIIAGTDGGAYYVDGDGDDSNELTDIAFNTTTNILSLTNPVTTLGGEVDLSSLANGSTVEADGTTITGVGTNADPFKIEPGADGQVLSTTAGAVTWAALPTGSVEEADGSTITGIGTNADPFKIEPGADGQVLSTTAGVVTWETLPTASIEEADGTTITGIGTNADPFKIEPSAVLGQFLRTEPITGAVIWDDLPPGTAGAVGSDGVTIIGDGVATDLQVIDGGITTTQIFDGTIATADIGNDAVTTDKIANAAILAEDLNQMGATANQVLKWNGTLWAPAADAAGPTVTPGTGLTLNGTDFDVDDLVGEVTGPTSATVIANNAVTTAKIANATILAEDLNQMGATANQVLKWNGTLWAPAADAAGTTVTPGTGLTLNGTDFDVDDLAGEVTGPTSATVIANNAVTTAKIANAAILAEDLNQMGATANQVLKWNGTLWAPAADTAGSTVTPGTGLTLNGTDFDVDDLAGEVTGPTSATVIANNAVTTAKIANAAILAEDLNQMGATANQVLKWNGTLWAPAADTAGSTVTPGTGLTLNGTDFDVDDLAGEVTGPTSATVIANNAVTTAKIANAAILAEDLNQMGATANQVLKWNGANWAPAADAGGTTVTPGTGLTLNGTDFDVDDLVGEVTGPTSATVIANNAVTTAKIANATILAEDLNQMGATANQVLKWNGTLWAPAADAAGTTVTPGTGLTLNGTDFDVDDLAGEVTGPTSATVIANNAVTTAKIANAAILAEDLNQMGATANQVLKWNGTLWAPAADAGGTTYTAGVGLTLNGTDFDVDNLAGEVTGPTSATVIANDAVTSAKIANGTIAAVDFNQMGAANDQVLKWNGTTWAPASDNDSGATLNNLATDNQTQDAEDRTYNLNGQELYFLGGNIGIGLSNPASQLDVQGQIQARDGFAATEGTAGQPSYGFYTGGDTNTGMFRVAEDAIGFSANGQEILRLQESAGNGRELIANGSLELTEQLFDENGNNGNPGNILTATATGTEWVAPSVVAMGKVDATATSVNTMGSNVSQTGTGNYTVTLTNAIPSANYIVQLTLQNASDNSFIQVTTQTATNFSVQILNVVGSVEDAQWFYTVTNF